MNTLVGRILCLLGIHDPVERYVGFRRPGRKKATVTKAVVCSRCKTILRRVA